jgi:hypothetical protein
LYADIIGFGELQAGDTIDPRSLMHLSIRKEPSATIASVAVPYQGTLLVSDSQRDALPCDDIVNESTKWPARNALLASDSRFRSPSLPGVGEFALSARPSLLKRAVQIGTVMTTGMASHEWTKVTDERMN